MGTKSASGVPSVTPFSVPPDGHQVLRPRRRELALAGAAARELRLDVGLVSASDGGTPSTMQPTPLQCDSPKVVTRKKRPKVLMLVKEAGATAWGVRSGEELT
ncbi:uncharacterized protein IUM83_09685 [Phytophthora cinnamomi]|uniref:uncharacterized protein n=1 Tax=Phytophthora cinnamomi TaxID=4785 RepID=UPI00355A0AC3|nr:hypothetical protein IUM83_09685 [Phytophthora cinnamomi]